MDNKITSYIGNLLYDNEIVIVPGLGGFVTAYNPSSIDHVQGLLHPPSKLISFNENLVVNDGILLNQILEAEQCTQSKAKTLLDTFVDNTKNALKAREIVVFPDVGRLYLDYEEKMQFLPDSVNYNTDVFGLPTVQYYPILRSRESVGNDAAKPEVQLATTVPAPQPSRRRWTKILQPAVPFVIAGLLVLGGIGIYSALDGKTNLFGKGKITPISLPHGNLNQSPSKAPYIEEERRLDEDEVDNHVQVDDVEDEADDYAEMMNELKREQEAREKAILESRSKSDEVIDTEGATLPPNQKAAVIVVHAFGNQDNVDKMVNNLIRKGYSPVKDSSKSLTRVGVYFPFKDNEDLRKILTQIQDRFNNGAYIVDDEDVNLFL